MAYRSGTFAPGTAHNDAAVGAVAWTDPDKAEVEDDDPAIASGAGISNWLECLGFNPGLIPGNDSPLRASIRFRRKTTPILTFPSLRSVTGYTNVGSTTSVAVTTPSGAQAGDVLVVHFRTPNGPRTFSAPSGDWFLYQLTTPGNGVATCIGILPLTSAPDPTYVFSFNTSTSTSHAVFCFQDVDADAFASDVSSNLYQTTGSTYSSSSVTIEDDVNASLLLKFDAASAGAEPFTPPTGMTAIVGPTYNNAVRAYSEEMMSVGATGSRVSSAGSVSQRATFMFALRGKYIPGAVVESAVEFEVDAETSPNFAVPTLWTGEYVGNILRGPWDISGYEAGDVNNIIARLSVESTGDIEAEVDVALLFLEWERTATVTIVDPEADDPIPWPAYTFEAEVEVGGTPVPITSAIWMIASDAEGENIVFRSDVVAGLTMNPADYMTTAPVPWTKVYDGGDYWVRLVVETDDSFDGEPIEGDSGWHHFTIAADLPLVTNVAAEPVTEEE